VFAPGFARNHRASGSKASLGEHEGRLGGEGQLLREWEAIKAGQQAPGETAAERNVTE
jgi:hypothetical protein